MMKLLYNISLSCLIFIILIASGSEAVDPENIITIAIFPCTDVVLSFKKFNPLITYLKEETGLDIKMVVPSDFEEFERAVKNGNIAFALQDPHIYNRLADVYDKSDLLGTLTRDGNTVQSGVVIVRKDSGIDHLSDLKGKSVMFGPKLSSAKWVAAKLLFEENGFNIDKDLKSYSNGKCCEDIAFSVYLHSADAGVICDHFLGEHSQKQQELGFKADTIKVIAVTRPVPTRVFAACRSIDADIITKINTALLNLDNRDGFHKDILYRAELGGFIKTNEKNFREIPLSPDLKTTE